MNTITLNSQVAAPVARRFLTNPLKAVRIGSTLLGALLILAGCSVAPTYERPSVETSFAFKEAQSATDTVTGAWKTAQPAENIARGDWWKIFNDEGLNALEQRAVQANQDLKAAAARLAQARALRQNARSDLFPQIDAGFGATRQRPSPASQGLAADAQTSPSTLYRAQAGISYEVDLFGRVSASVNAANADAEDLRCRRFPASSNP